MPDKNPDLAKLPRMALEEIPEPNADAARITPLVKSEGRITGYQLSNGRVLTKEEGVQLAKSGGIRDVGVATREGTQYLKSLPDEREENNLGNLPSIQE